MLLGTKELKARGYSDYLIRQMCHRKDSPFFRTGKKWRVSEEALEKFERKVNLICQRTHTY